MNDRQSPVMVGSSNFVCSKDTVSKMLGSAFVTSYNLCFKVLLTGVHP